VSAPKSVSATTPIVMRVISRARSTLCPSFIRSSARLATAFIEAA
jgi:hypothetical protein